MKLLVLSHACVTPVNQQLFAAVEQKAGWEVDIILPSNWLNDYTSSIKAGRWPGFSGRLIEVPVLKPGSIPLHVYRKSLRAIIRSSKPDAIYVQHEPYAAATYQLYRANARTLRKPIGFFTWQNIEKRYPIPFRQMEHSVLRHSVVAFSGSESAEQVLRDKGFSGKTVLLPGSVDPEMYSPQASANALKSEWCDAGTVAIGYVGRIVEEKGLANLLHALKRIERLPWKLVMVGKGPFEAEFNSLASTLGLSDRVLQLGYVPHDQIPVYLSAFDMLVVPSETRPNWKEQFGRVIIEAMACGTPVIGSDSGEIPFLIRATGGGLAFKEGDPADFAAALETLISDPNKRSQLAATGGDTVRSRYSHDAVVTNFVAAWKDVTR